MTTMPRWLIVVVVPLPPPSPLPSRDDLVSWQQQRVCRARDVVATPGDASTTVDHGFLLCHPIPPTRPTDCRCRRHRWCLPHLPCLRHRRGCPPPRRRPLHFGGLIVRRRRRRGCPPPCRRPLLFGGVIVILVAPLVFVFAAVVIVASLLFSGVVVILVAPSCLLRLRLRGRRRVVTRQSHVVAVRSALSSIIMESGHVGTSTHAAATGRPPPQQTG